MGTAAVITALIAACAPRTRLAPLEPSHPACAAAPEAAVIEPADILRRPSVAGTAEEPAAEMPRGHGMMHGTGGTTRHDAPEDGARP